VSRRRCLVPARGSLAVTTAAAALVAGPTLADESPLEDLLRRAGAYVVAYEQSLSAVIAEEYYDQRFYRPAHGRLLEIQQLRSDVVIVRSEAGGLPWLLLRDVFQVNGEDVRDRDDRLARLLLSGDLADSERARAIIDEGARFNLGAPRNYNVPTLALAFLHPDVQPRFRFERRGSGQVEGRRFVEVHFEEVSRPTIVRLSSENLDVPATGQVWIDPDDGTVGRTALRLEPSHGPPFVAELETHFRPQPAFGMWLPVEMRDRWETPPVRQPGQRKTSMSVEGEATYSNFRRPHVEIEESYRVPE
jgi:hypothetical protein